MKKRDQIPQVIAKIVVCYDDNSGEIRDMRSWNEAMQAEMWFRGAEGFRDLEVVRV